MSRTHATVGFVVGIACHLVSRLPKSGRSIAWITPAKDPVPMEDEV